MAENEQLGRHTQLNEWITTVATNLPHLSKPQATVLALFSFGMVLVKCCALTTVVLILAPLLKLKENTLRQRLREWCYDACELTLVVPSIQRMENTTVLSVASLANQKHASVVAAPLSRPRGSSFHARFWLVGNKTWKKLGSLSLHFHLLVVMLAGMDCALG